MACEEYYADEELLDGDLCPIHKRPVEYFEEENYFFRLSRFQDRLLDWYAAHPGSIVARVPAATRRSASSAVACETSRSAAPACKWGIPLPWDAKHVAYVWFDALVNYITAVGFGSDDPRPAFETWWPARHLIGKDIIRLHCVYWPAMLMSAGIELPAGWAVGGWLLVGGEKMSKTVGQRGEPARPVDEFGVDGFRYHVLADTTYGPDGDFTYEGIVEPLQQRPRQQPRQPAVASGHRRRQEVRRRRPRTARRLATRRGRRGRVRRHRDRMGRGRNPTVRSTSTWSLIRATNAYLEANEPWKAEPGPAVDAVMGDALEALRIVADPRLARAARHQPGRLGTHRPHRPGRAISGCPRPRPGVATRAASPW